jgi:signal transduction histidine kinase
MAATPRKTRLQSRILLWSFVPTTIILFAVAVTIFIAYQQVTQNLVIGRNQQLTRLSAGELAANLNDYVDVLRTLANSADIVSGHPTRQQAALEQHANQLLVFDEGLLVLTPQGRVVVAQPARPDLIGQDWSSRPFIRQIIGGLNGKPTFSDILYSSPTELGVIGIAYPVLNDQSELRGMLVGLFHLGANSYSAFYGGIVKLRLGDTGSMYLIDGAGRIIYHPDETRIGRDATALLSVQQALKKQPGALRTRDFAGHQVLASFAPVPGTSWSLINEEDWASLLLLSLGYGQFLIFLLALGVTIPTLVVTFGVRRITGPVEELISAASEIADGKFGQQIVVGTGDELEELGAQFNRMSAQLKESYTQLEDRVAARTRELAALNAITAVSSRSLDIQAVMRDTLCQTLEVMGMDTGMAFVLDEHEDCLRMIAECGHSPEVSGWIQQNPMLASFMREKAPTGLPFTWRQQQFPDTPVRAWLEKIGIEQVIYIPLTTKERLVGALAIAGPGLWSVSREAETLLAAIGQQIGVAVENARLYQQAETTAAAAERSRLARELHDSVTQSLYSVTLYAEAAISLLKTGDPVTAADHLQELRNTAQEALREMRLLIFELRPPALEQNGLAAALQARLDSVETRAGIKSRLKVSGEECLPLRVQEELYHIAQEALNNILKHAQAHSVEVTIACDGSYARLEVRDDGVGFDPQNRQRGGLGLAGMQERAQKIAGELAIESAPGQGTRVSIQVPIASRL